MGVVNLDKALRMLIHELNADPASAFVNTVTEDGKQGDAALKECLLLADADVCGLYLDNPLSSYGEPFLALSAELDHGDAVPAHGGALRDIVFVKIAAADTEFVKSTPADSVEEIRRWRRNLNNVYSDVAHDAANSPLGARHKLEGGHVYFTGSKAKIKLPQFSIDRATPACKADERHSGLVVSRAINYAHKEGYASDWLFAKHEGLFSAGAALILSEGKRSG